MTVEKKRIVRVKERLLKLEPVLPGSLSKQWNVCGSPRCKCKNPVHPVNPTFAIRTEKQSFSGINRLETLDFTGVDFQNGL
mgnify:CR=1 FL=1